MSEPTSANVPGATAAMEHHSNGSLGLTGVWKAAANLSAAAILAGSFLYLQHEMLSQAKEDRVLFREELRTLRSEATEDRKAMHQLNDAIRTLTTEVQKVNKARDS